MSRVRWADLGIGVLAVGTVLLIVLAVMKQRPVSSASPATAPSAPSVTPSVRQPAAVFIGDAYTAGVGSDGTRWTTLVADRLGWTEVNLAHAGTGYLTSATGAKATAACGQDRCPAYGEVVPDAVAASPDVVVISGGRIDATRDVTNAAATLFTNLRTKAPEARVVVLSPLWDDAAAPSYLTTEAKAVQKSAQKAGVEYVDIGQPLTGRTDLMTSDGVYPNAAGHRAIADVVAAKLAATTPSTPASN